MKKIILFFIAILSFLFVGCEEKNKEPEKKYWNVTFETDGGKIISGESKQVVLDKTKISVSDFPKVEKEGYEFIGWFYENSLIADEIIISKDMIINAMWEKVNVTDDNLEWTNNEALYVTIKEIYSNEILQNIEKSFEEYACKKIYVVNKELKKNGTYKLKMLFIINQEMTNFISKLKLDERIESFSLCKDLPYESIDNRYMAYTTDTINVGEKLTISLKGDCDFYTQRFLYNLFYIIPNNYDDTKEYNKADFPEINNIIYIEKQRGKLLLLIENSEYYEIIKTIDKLARTEYIQFIDFSYIEVFPPIWEIDNKEIVDLVINSDNSITITALKPGTISIKYDGIQCNITIKNN